MEIQLQEETEARILHSSLAWTLRLKCWLKSRGDELEKSIKVFIKCGKIIRKSVEDGTAILQKSDRREGFWHDIERVIIT